MIAFHFTLYILAVLILGSLLFLPSLCYLYFAKKYQAAQKVNTARGAMLFAILFSLPTIYFSFQFFIGQLGQGNQDGLVFSAAGIGLMVVAGLIWMPIYFFGKMEAPKSGDTQGLVRSAYVIIGLAAAMFFVLGVKMTYENVQRCLENPKACQLKPESRLS